MKKPGATKMVVLTSMTGAKPRAEALTEITREHGNVIDLSLRNIYLEAEGLLEEKMR